MRDVTTETLLVLYLFVLDMVYPTHHSALRFSSSPCNFISTTANKMDLEGRRCKHLSASLEKRNDHVNDHV
jgi:hypothetical protein